MRILYVAPRECWPVTSGARVRDYNLARQLSKRCELTYVAFSDQPATEAGSGIEQILVPRPKGYSPLTIVRGLAGPVPVTVLNYSTAAMADKIRAILSAKPFDFVQIEGIHFYSYIHVIRAANSKPRILCDWHNVESELMQRFSAHGNTPLLKRLYGSRTASLIRDLEKRLLAKCDVHTVCSERERALLSARDPKAQIVTVPNGVDVEYFRAPGLPEPKDIVFVGSMDYHANIDAVLYFAREIWPLLRDEMPHRKFVVVGARPVQAIVDLAKEQGIEVTGTVPDIRPYYQTAAAVVVPLRVGSGTRLKVLEAMAAGAPIVSTTLGAEGIDYTAGRDLLIADSPAAFAESVRNLIADPGLSHTISAGGASLVERLYDWNIIGENLFRIYRENTKSAGDR